MCERIHIDVEMAVASFDQALADAIPRGYRLACGMLHNPTEAEDIVQEAALKAWRKQNQLRPGTDVTPWFLGIVANECRSHFRRKWSSVLKIATPPNPAPLETTVERTDLRNALLRLSYRDRLTVVLYFYFDLSLEEVAQISGTSIGAARGRLYRSIGKLRPGVEIEEALK